ncbi:hypothetical protein TNCV_3321221 [Trichonephila clavipes]|nr:hypothetical protein TNCV_3321221 [Trichonephila clavipes]
MPRVQVISNQSMVGSGGLEVALPLRKPKVVGTTPPGVDTFSGCENRRHAYRMIIWHVKDPLSINLSLVLLVKLNHSNVGHLMRA